MRPSGWVATLGLVALLAPSASGASPWRVERVIEADDLDAGGRPGAWSGRPLSLADVDLDGDLDVIAHNSDGRVYAVDARSGRALVVVEPRYPYGPDLGPFNAARAADLDGDGAVDLVVVNRAAVVSVWRFDASDGAPLRATLSWERHLDDFHWRPTADAGPVLGDLDADGKLEIVAHTEERGLFALRHDGSLLWRVDAFGGNAEPVVADVDADGDLDVVVWTDGGVAYALEGATSRTLWRFDARAHGVWPASVPSPGVVEDLDGDGRVDVVFCARNVENATTEKAPGAPRYKEHHFVLFAIEEGRLQWKAKPAWGNPMCGAYLVAVDVNGEGRRLVVGMDWNTIGHKPGGWERLGPANVFAFDASGREVWRRELNAWNSKFPFAVADVDADGRQDVVAYDGSALVLLDAATGEPSKRLKLQGWRVAQGPVVADLWGDGRQRIVLAADKRSDALLVVEAARAKSAAAWPGWWEPARPSAVVAPPVVEAAPPTEPAPQPEFPARPSPFTAPRASVDPLDSARAVPVMAVGLTVGAALLAARAVRPKG